MDTQGHKTNLCLLLLKANPERKRQKRTFMTCKVQGPERRKGTPEVDPSDLHMFAVVRRPSKTNKQTNKM